MTQTRKSRLALLPAVFAVLLLGPVALGQGKGKKDKSTSLEKAAKQATISKEAEVLRAAYILMAGANHNYEGHRVKAMREVHAAVSILDRGILKSGTDGQKMVALQEDIIAARAKFLAKHAAKVHEPQALSDLQMREAHRLLVELRGVLGRNKQPKVLHHVDRAIREIQLALKSRL